MKINNLLKILCFAVFFTAFGCQKAQENNFITVRQNGEMTLFSDFIRATVIMQNSFLNRVSSF